MSTSLTEASTTGMVTSGAPSPTNTRTPPERVACSHTHTTHMYMYKLYVMQTYIDGSGNAWLST